MDWKNEIIEKNKFKFERKSVYTNKVHLYLSDTERKKLDEDVERLKLNRSQIVRSLLSNEFIYSKLHAELLNEFRKLNNNVNQISRKLNSNEKIENLAIEKLDYVLAEYMKIYKTIKKIK